jgi:hypothetical protein
MQAVVSVTALVRPKAVHTRAVARLETHHKSAVVAQDQAMYTHTAS